MKATTKKRTSPGLAHNLAVAGLAVGGIGAASVSHAALVTGEDPAGYRTGYFDLQMGAGDLAFNGTRYDAYPAFNYQTVLSTGAGTELIFGPALAAGTVIDAHDSFAGGSELLYSRWQNGYMQYVPGGGGCDRYGCWSYPGNTYPVVTGGGTSGAWAGSQSGFLGFRFLDNGWHYGWAELTVSDSNFDILRWAYEDQIDIGIAAGSTTSLAPALLSSTQNVPEPGSLALLALGVAGLGAFRKRQH